MSFDVSNRDRYWFLTGIFEQGTFTFPIEVLDNILPFLFPCQKCGKIEFHVAAIQHAGLGVKLPFMRRPLASTGKKYQALCNTCTTVNTHLTYEMVAALENGLIPAQICNLYFQVCDKETPLPYSEEFNNRLLEGIPGERKELKGYVVLLLKYYGLWTDPQAVYQVFCRKCQERVKPKQPGALRRLLGDSFLCPTCGKHVSDPLRWDG